MSAGLRPKRLTEPPGAGSGLAQRAMTGAWHQTCPEGTNPRRRANVVGDLLLERLEPLEELFRRDRVSGLARSEEPRSGLDGGLPACFLGALAVDGEIVAQDEARVAGLGW